MLRVGSVVKDEGKRVFENSDGFFKTDAGLPNIVRGFCGIPLEFRRRSIVLFCLKINNGLVYMV